MCRQHRSHHNAETICWKHVGHHPETNRPIYTWDVLCILLAYNLGSDDQMFPPPSYHTISPPHKQQDAHYQEAPPATPCAIRAKIKRK